MTNPWELYERLIDEIPPEPRVTSAVRSGQWCRVGSDCGGVGMAFNLPEQSRPRSRQDDEVVGMGLRDAAALARSWNLAEAGMGAAALNAWYAAPEVASAHGFAPCLMNNFAHLFDPWIDEARGRRVGVIGHFPFARRALAEAGEVVILERSTRDGDYPDSACEYELASCDLVFITGSSFVNKTAPRLLALTADCPRTIVVGPSTPASPALLDYGADTVLAFSCADAARLEDGLAGRLLAGMYDAGERIELHREGAEPSGPVVAAALPTRVLPLAPA
ncbi:DUF364 domain-containing protein [Actinomyces sp. B33]|uniref:Rossmann-like domain-containing protein n=1 Tax=Actinomyces sp. B33 TaxID=2942131 RepID=UPI002340DC3F|nr:DUF364 domain-containing protein [Actinomyces sp. B33]MDC4232168.1 DUF364 domain-containing protein [Actinomyces sp. B33]